MHKTVSFLFLFLTTGSTLMLHSCTPGACFEETNSFLKASLYNISAKKLLAPDSLTLYGLNNDTNKIYNRSGSIQPALFPLNSATGNSVFVIKINGAPDTINFIYSSYPHLISKECGFTFYHILDTLIYTTHKIDTITAGNKKITTVNEENIRIYY